MLKLRLFPLMEADGAGADGADGADNATQDKPNAHADKSGQRDADERETGDA